jgi:hypothetical protein
MPSSWLWEANKRRSPWVCMYSSLSIVSTASHDAHAREDYGRGQAPIREGPSERAPPPLTNYRFSGIDEFVIGSSASANFGEA